MLRDKSEDDSHPIDSLDDYLRYFLHDALASRLRVLQSLLTGALLPLFLVESCYFFISHGKCGVSVGCEAKRAS